MNNIFGRFERKILAGLWLSVVGISACLYGGEGALTWDIAALSRPPQTYPVADYPADEAKPLFYEALPYQGKATRVFAWVGLPKVEPGKKVPAMVLVHGGGGTAFLEWVKLWNQRGYAAIAMDVNGTMPVSPKIPHNDFSEKGRPVHEWAGPIKNLPLMVEIDKPQDHWVYHAVADVILAHSLIRSFPEIDTGHIGLTGISWGGFLTSIVASVDDRLEFAIPVYGCGYIAEAASWKAFFDQSPPGDTEKWMQTFDPSIFVANIHIPTLWINGNNDPHYPLSIHSRTFAKAGEPKNLSIIPRLGHSHPAGWEPKEIYAYADSFAKDSAPLARVIHSGLSNKEAWATFHSAVPVESAELYSTADTSDWVKCEWKSTPATIDPNAWKISVALPQEAKACFLNLKDSSGLIVSSPLMIIQP